MRLPDLSLLMHVSLPHKLLTALDNTYAARWLGDKLPTTPSRETSYLDRKRGVQTLVVDFRTSKM